MPLVRFAQPPYSNDVLEGADSIEHMALLSAPSTYAISGLFYLQGDVDYSRRVIEFQPAQRGGIFWSQALNESSYSPPIPNNAQSGSDTTSPILTGLSITPGTVDVSGGSASVSVGVSYTDELSGISSVAVWLVSPSGRNVAGANIWNLTSGDKWDGTYSGTLNIPQYSENGDYSVTISLHDGAGNSRYVEHAEDLFGTNLIVHSAQSDSTAPVLTGLSVISNAVDVSNGPASVSVAVSYTEDLSGISSVAVWFVSPSGTNVAGANIWSLTRGDKWDGTYSGTLNIPQHSEIGDYSVTIALYDATGNERYVEHADDLFGTNLIVGNYYAEKIFEHPSFSLATFGVSAGGWTSNNQYPRAAADINGDGRADLVGFGDSATYVALANADGTFQSLILAIGSFAYSAAGGGWAGNDKYPRTLGDVNGDGRADIVGFGDAATYVAIANADGTFQSPIVGINSFGYAAAAGGWSGNDKYPRTAADVNGDGRADLVGFGDAGVYVSLANSNGTFENPILALASFGFSAAAGGWMSDDKYPRTLGDVNGDGRADLVGFGDVGVYVALANANGTFQSPTLAAASFGYSPAGGGWRSENQYPRVIADVNGDGDGDIVGFRDDGVWLALSNGDGTFTAPVRDLQAFGANTGGWSSNNQYPRTVADVNGDGAADIVGFGDAGAYVALGQDFIV